MKLKLAKHAGPARKLPLDSNRIMKPPPFGLLHHESVLLMWIGLFVLIWYWIINRNHH